MHHARKAAAILGVFILLFLLQGDSSNAAVPVRVIRFDDVKPTGAVITSTFEAAGFDDTGKVYVALCDSAETIPGRGNCFVFSFNPATGAKRYYDNFLDAADRVGNLGPNAFWSQRETLVKGHTHLWFMNNQMWMGTMNIHGYQPEDLSRIRGLHLMALDLGTGKLIDHAQWQPQGVFHAGGGTYTVAVVPEQNMVLSIGVPNCTIIKYNPTTRATTKTAGVPHEDNPQLSGRDMVVLAGGNLLYQCGSGTTHFGLYNINTGTNEELPINIGTPLSLSYTPTSDKQFAYISDGRQIWKFSLASKTITLVGSLDPTGGNNQTSPVNLSPDEKKLYYIINQAGGDGGAYVDDLYEFNLETGVKTKLMNLKASLGEAGAKFSGSHMMAPNWKLYQVFNGATAGLVEIDLSSRIGVTTTVATPVISPSGGTFTTSQTVTISDSTAGATIRYTTNGTDPTVASTLYTGAITLTTTATVKAKAFKTGLTDSVIASATFTKSGGTTGGTTTGGTGGTTGSVGGSCLMFASGSVAPSGYSPAWDVFDASRPLLVKTNCPTSGTSLTLTVGKGDSSQLTYNKTYSYHPELPPASRWQAQTLSGVAHDANWIDGNGTTVLTAPTTASASNPFFFVGYVCTNVGSVWKCGCENTSCTVGKWQLQAYKGLSSGTTGGTTGGGETACETAHPLLRNPFNKISAHHRPIGAGATIGIPRGISKPDFDAGKRSAAFLQDPVMSMSDALARIGDLRLGTSDQGRKGIFCVSASDSNAAGSGASQVFREFVINSGSETIDHWTTNTTAIRIPKGDTVRGGNDGVYYPPFNGGDYTYAFGYRDGGGVPILDMFTDFAGPIDSTIANADPSHNARVGEMGYSDYGSYRLDGSDTQETLGYAKSAARLRWPGTVLRGFEINPANPAPIRHSFNVAATRQNSKGATNAAHIVGKQIVWPAYSVDGSLADNYNRTDQNQGGFPYGTNLRVPIADYATVAAQLSGNPRGLALLHALTYYGLYIVDGHGEYVDTPEGKKGVMQIRIDAEVGRNPDGSDIPGVVDDANSALRIIMPYLKPVGNPPLWSDLRSQDSAGLPYLGGGGPINSNSVNTAYDAP